MVHTSFTDGGPAAKKARLREAGLWALDPPSYFSCCQPARSRRPAAGRWAAAINATAAAAEGSGGGGISSNGSGRGDGGSGGSEAASRSGEGSDGVGSGGGGGGHSERRLLPPHGTENGFLAYDNTVDAAMAAAAAEHQAAKARPMAQLHMHFAAAAYQLATFRDALAVARWGQTGRTCFVGLKPKP